MIQIAPEDLLRRELNRLFEMQHGGWFYARDGADAWSEDDYPTIAAALEKAKER